MSKISQSTLIIIIAALSQLFQQLIANMATVIIPEIAMELNIASDWQLWINLIYLCSLVAFSLPLAKVISKYGVKKSVYGSCILIIVSLILCAFSFDFYMILIARLLQGISSASLAISIYMMLTEELSEERLGTALGIVGACGYLGLMLAPSLTGLITYMSDWRMSFLVIIPIFVLQLFLLTWVENEWYGEDNPIDNIGSLFLAVIIACFTVGLSELDSHFNFLLLVSFILVPVFIRYEKKVEYPILNVGLFRNVKFMIGNYAAMVTYFVTTIAITVLTFHLIYPEDMNLDLVGFILLVTPLVMVFVSIIAGKLSSKYDSRLISGCAMIIIFVAMVLFTFMDYLSIPLIIVACIIQGVGHGFFSSPNNKYVLTLVDEKDLGDASAMISTSKEFGKILSSGIYVLLISILLDGVVLGPSHFDDALIYTNFTMMNIACIMALSAIILIFYSYFKYEKYENPEIIKFFYSLVPERIKNLEKRNKAPVADD